MRRLYNTDFSQPWNFREYFRKNDPAVFKTYFAYQSEYASDKRVRFQWDQRYALAPNSPEFAAIPWREGVQVYEAGNHLAPLRMAVFDIDNDGSQESVFHVGFYGRGMAEDARDRYFIFSDPSLASSSKTAFTHEDFFVKDAMEGRVEAAVLRPLLLNAIVYLSVYFDTAWVGEKPCCRHVPPESMTVAKVKKGSAIGPRSDMQLETVCQFNMRVTRDPERDAARSTK